MLCNETSVGRLFDLELGSSDRAILLDFFDRNPTQGIAERVQIITEFRIQCLFAGKIVVLVGSGYETRVVASGYVGEIDINPFIGHSGYRLQTVPPRCISADRHFLHHITHVSQY